MALTPFTSTITAAALRSNFDDKTTTLNTNAKVGRKDHSVGGECASLITTTNLCDRSVPFTPQDDVEIAYLEAHGTVAGAGTKLKVAVAVDNGDTTFLVDNTFESESAVSVGAGAIATRIGFTTTSGTRGRLLKGVKHRLTVSVDAGTVTDIAFQVVLRSVRRRS